LNEVTESLEDLNDNYKSFVDPDEFSMLLKMTHGNELICFTDPFYLQKHVIAKLSLGYGLFDVFAEKEDFIRSAMIEPKETFVRSRKIVSKKLKFSSQQTPSGKTASHQRTPASSGRLNDKPSR